MFKGKHKRQTTKKPVLPTNIKIGLKNVLKTQEWGPIRDTCAQWSSALKKIKQWFTKCASSPPIAASASRVNLLEMKMLWPCPQPTNRGLSGPATRFNKPARWLWCIIKFENCWCKTQGKYLKGSSAPDLSYTPLFLNSHRIWPPAPYLWFCQMKTIRSSI